MTPTDQALSSTSAASGRTGHQRTSGGRVDARQAQLLIAALLLLVGLQQPWQPGLIAGGQLLAAVLTTIVALVGVVAAWNATPAVTAASHARGMRDPNHQQAFPAETPRQWVARCAQVPLIASALWLVAGSVYGGGAAGARSIGIGAILALAGATLALTVTWRRVVPAAGLICLAAAAYPLVAVLVADQPWAAVTRAAIYLVAAGLLAFWLVLPIAQYEFPALDGLVGRRTGFRPGTVENATASRTVLLALGLLVAALAVFTGTSVVARPFWLARAAQGSGLGVILLPVLAALVSGGVVSQWRRCAPALLRLAVESAAVKVVATLFGYCAALGVLSLIDDGVAVLPVVVVMASLMVITACVGVQLGYVQTAPLMAALGRGARALVGQSTQGGVTGAGAARVGQPVSGGAVGWGSTPANNANRHRAAVSLRNSAEQIGIDLSSSDFDVAKRWPGWGLAAPTNPAPPTSLAASTSPAAPEATWQPAAREAGSVAAEPAPVTSIVEARLSRANTTTRLPVAQAARAGGLGLVDGQTVVALERPKWTPQQALDPATHTGLLTRIAVEAPHLRPQVAGNPSAGPELLNWLSELGDPDVNLAMLNRQRLAS